MSTFISIERDDAGKLRVEAEGFTLHEVARYVAVFAETWTPAADTAPPPRIPSGCAR